MTKAGYNPGAAEDPETNPDYQVEHKTAAGTEPEPKPKPEESTTAHVGH
jgi:hypothetical protein